MSSQGLLQRIYIQIATAGPVGRLPIAPGTWGSLFAAVIWWFFLSSKTLHDYSIIVILSAFIAIRVSSRAEQSLGKDAGAIVIDEVVGQWIALAFCKRSLILVAISFFMFRLFDIWKPYPIRGSQRLKGGVGVVIDDVLAGIYTLLCLLIIQRIWFE